VEGFKADYGDDRELQDIPAGISPCLHNWQTPCCMRIA